jgi:hypothetical protein
LKLRTTKIVFEPSNGGLAVNKASNKGSQERRVLAICEKSRDDSIRAELDHFRQPGQPGKLDDFVEAPGTTDPKRMGGVSWFATALALRLALKRHHLLVRSGNTMTQTTLSPNAAIDFEKSHMRATAPGFRAGITIVSPLAHFLISSDALASLSKNPAEAGKQYREVGAATLGDGGGGGI